MAMHSSLDHPLKLFFFDGKLYCTCLQCINIGQGIYGVWQIGCRGI